MEEILQFLRDLEQNNNRDWFNANKPRYQHAQQLWNAFCEQLIAEVGRFDPAIAPLTVQNCTYRIYRDTRFSADKTPYKTHFGVFMCPGGKKSMHAGYYFHLGTGIGDGYPHAHMLAAGNYCYDPKAIKILREDISDDWENFSRNVLGAADSSFTPDMDGALKRVPREYPADAPYADWMRMRNFCLVTNVDDAFVLAPDLARRVATLFSTTARFTAFVNRAVDYVLENQR
ncbi:MAG: DUF2461 domain-containing protein [Muribaculaceae bacterium]